MHWDKVAIIGMGLIGGSVAKGLATKHLSQAIIAIDSCQQTLNHALEKGIVNAVSTDISAIKGAELIICATPIASTASISKAIADALDDDTVVIDVMGVKQPIIAAMREALGVRFKNFVPMHPIAGKEHHGINAAEADLFKAHKVIITPVEETSAKAIESANQLWTLLGADIITLTPAEHDEFLAATSHVPHVLSYALMDTLAKTEHGHNIFRFAAGGLRDFSRIAASDPGMWCDISFANKSEINKLLKVFIADLSLIVNALESDDTEAVNEVFTNGKTAKEYFTHLLNQRNTNDTQ